MITGYRGDHGKSYTIRQADGIPVLHSFYRDLLRLFRLCEGYLQTGMEQEVPGYLNLRAGRGRSKLPKELCNNVDRAVSALDIP